MDIEINNDFLFFKCFRSLVIKNHIFSFLKNQNSDNSYESSISLKKLASKNRFEMILDKLKSNHFIFINHEGLRDLYLETYKFLPQYEEIYRLLWNSYKERLRRLNSLDYSIKENSIQQFKSLSKILYLELNKNNYKSSESFQNNSGIKYYSKVNRNNVIDQTYRLYSLMDLALENSTIEIAKCILDLINSITFENNRNKKKARVEISTLPTSAINNENYTKIHVLLKIQHSFTDNHIQFRQFLIDNRECSMEALIQASKKYIINSNSNTVNRELFYYFGVYLIYYYLQQNNYNQIEMLLNYSQNSSSILCINLIFYYSIFNLSIDTFNFYLSFINGPNNTNRLNKDIIFKLKNYYEEIDTSSHSIEIAKQFFNFLISDGNCGAIIIYNWFEIFKVIIVYYDSQLLEYLLIHNEKFRTMYSYYMVHYFKDMLEIHFKRNKTTKQFNNKNIEIFIQQMKSVELSKKNVDQLLKKLKTKKCIILLNHFLKNYQYNQQQPEIINEEIYSNFKNIYSFQNQFNVDQTIQLYLNLDQDSVNIFFKFKEKNPFYLNKSNILILNLIKSIIFKEYSQIVKIISTLQINSTLTTEDLNNVIGGGNKEIIGFLFLNGYLDPFDIECLLEEIFKQIDIDKQFIFDLIPSEKNQLKNQYKESFYDLITIKYHVDDISKETVKEDEDNESKSLVMLLYEGYYQKVWEYFQTNGAINKKLDVADSIYRDLPIDYFVRFYDPLIKVHLDDSDKVLEVCLYRFDILEFLWIHHLDHEQKKDLILKIFSEMNNMNCHPIIEYILKEKKQFIYNDLQLDNDHIYKLHRNALVDGDISIYQLIRSIFTSFNFQIDFSIIKEVLHFDSGTARYDVIEYLYDNNLIPNFKDIIKGQKILIREFNNRFIVPGDNSTIIVTRSMFILIYTIIRLQEQAQLNKEYYYCE
ncbi:hypothetical protein DICPUDRAFT_150877 [Dictyostelium purpureum]|uniref:Uncharacterized protein n=1 Tax=Dictyostelium purpureum TaxID=5786 RepID=F0ZHH1_DICPU|nr:uncharacterized protein DICPUDRAFT_150877 [Dictyostelium purpureum]EGC36629.1 hypothetical protein DICPUDRAFT_150877 [Dictyostelium purpureum]|eukprot:XP_003286867.1 hypothetical protein DICPUDRAFT_150877 [Dictyostelium purpureum]